MYWWRITLSNALLWSFWEDPAVSSLREGLELRRFFRAGMQSMPSRRVHSNLVSLPHTTPSIKVESLKSRSFGVFKLLKSFKGVLKVWTFTQVYQVPSCSWGCTFQDLTYRTPDESRMDATVNYEARDRDGVSDGVFCLTALHLGHPKSLVRLHVFRPLCCSMEGLFGVGHSIQAAITTMLWVAFAPYFWSFWGISRFEVCVAWSFLVCAFLQTILLKKVRFKGPVIYFIIELWASIESLQVLRAFVRTVYGLRREATPSNWTLMMAVACSWKVPGRNFVFLGGFLDSCGSCWL